MLRKHTIRGKLVNSAIVYQLLSLGIIVLMLQWSHVYQNVGSEGRNEGRDWYLELLQIHNLIQLHLNTSV